MRRVVILFPLQFTALLIVMGLLSSPVFAQGRCTTKWNALFKQYETHCDDGSSATEKYNQPFRQWDQTITPGPQQPNRGFQPEQRCTRKYNALFKQWETTCD